MRFVDVVASIVLGCALSACAEVEVVEPDPEAEEEDVELDPSTSRWSFELPSEGVPNDNGSIGPFCCTGLTAIVKAEDGSELGYAYFYTWDGQAYLTGEDSSSAPDFTVLIAGLPDLDADPSTTEYDTSEIAFSAGELESGLSRSAQAGALLFTVTIRHAEVEQWSTGPMFDMGSLTVRIDVDPVE